jgi:VCBS repeat-containing protein
MTTTWQELDIATMTNLYLYGTFNTPSNKVDETLIRSINDITITITNVDDFMKNGPGRFATPNQFASLNEFMQGGYYEFFSERSSGEYDINEIAPILDGDYPSNRIFSTQEYYYYDNINDHETRTYVFGSVSFVVKSATLVVNLDGTRYIKDLVIAPFDDNFDYTSGNPMVQIADTLFLQSNTDPSYLGRTVEIEFNSNDINSAVYTNEDYIKDINSDIYHPIDGLVDAISYTLNVPEFLWDNGTTQFIDSQGRAIIYGTNGDDSFNVYGAFLNGTHNFPNGSFMDDYYSSHIQNGIAIVTGDGNDFLSGGNFNDYLEGGKGADQLVGGSGFDTYVSDNGDTIFDEDGKGEVYFDKSLLTGGKKEAGSGCEPTEEDGSSKYYGNGGVYTLSGDTLIFEKGGETLTIQNFTSGKLGITLDENSGGGNDCSPPGGDGGGSGEGGHCPGPITPSFGFYITIPLKPAAPQISDGGDPIIYHSGSGGGVVLNGKPLIPSPVSIQCVNHPNYSSAGAGGGGGSTGPIVLDLNHDGITSISIAASIALFDYDGDGIKENTAWIQSTDALLVNDVNNDGLINDASELFGNYTRNSDGSIAKGGYQALSYYDTNNDRVVDVNDTRFAELKLWIDANGDGITDDGELKTLSELGITSLKLNDAATPYIPTAEDTNTIVQETTFTDANGEGVMRDVLFRYENDSERTDGVYFDMDGNGIKEKMITWTDPNQWMVVRDINGDGIINSGKEVVGNHMILPNGTMAPDTIQALKAFDINHDGKIDASDNSGLAFWTDRNHNGITDIGELEALGDPGAIQVIKLNPYQTLLSGYDNGDGIIDSRDAVYNYLYIQSNPDDTITIYLPDNDMARPMIEGYIGGESIQTSDGEKVIKEILFYDGYEMELNDTIVGTDGSETLEGSSRSDTISGMGGKDIIDAGAGDDIINGGTGSDKLMGGDGNDTYIYAKGDGKDLIIDSNGNDNITFGEGITKDDIIVKSNGTDISIYIKDGDKTLSELTDQIIIKDWYSTDSIETINFSNGVSIDKQDITALVPADDDGYVLIGNNGDIINGITGNNTYVFNRGDGQYIIKNLDSSDVIKIGAGIIANDLIVHAEGNNIIIGIKEDGKSFDELSDKITVVDGYDAYMYNIYSKTYVDLTLYDSTVINAKPTNLTPSNDSDNIFLGNNNDEIHALDGNDYIYGNGGDDILYGDDGDDYIDGDSGNNIIVGGKGDDRLEGSDWSYPTSFHNIFIFNRGDGSDIIYGRNGNDILKFGTGVTANDLIIHGENGTDLVVGIRETGKTFDELSDKIIIKNGYLYNNINIMLTDGAYVDSTPNDTVISDGDDEIYLGNSNDEIHALGGNDTIYGNGGDYILYGDDGNDYINGGSGNNVIVGGKGNDYINGGNYTYIFNRGDGQDDIHYNGQVTLKFSSDITVDDLVIMRDSSINFTIGLKEDGKTFDELSDKITFSAGGIEGEVPVPQIFLEDGSKINIDSLPKADIVDDENYMQLGSFSDSFDDFATDTILQIDSIESMQDSDISSFTLQSRYTGSGLDGASAQTVFEGVGYTGTLSNIWLRSDTLDTQYTYNGTISEEVQALPNIDGQGNVIDLQYVMNEKPDLAQGVVEFQSLAENGNLADFEANIDKIIEEWALYDLGAATSNSTPPIVLDLDGDGITSQTLTNSTAYFDYDGDGRREHTAWTDVGDALLVVDINKDGVITKGTELFGNYSVLDNGMRAADGYEAMSQYDSNGDNILDASDEQFNELKLWKDTNQNGKNDEGELSTLTENGIIAINLSRTDGTTFTQIKEAGNVVTNETNYIGTNGDGIVRDVWFSYDGTDTITYSTLSDNDEKKIAIVENFYGRRLSTEERASVEVIAEVIDQYNALRYDTIAKIITDKLYGENFPNCTFLHYALNNTLSHVVNGMASTAETLLAVNLLAALIKREYASVLSDINHEYFSDPTIANLLSKSNIAVGFEDGALVGHIGNQYFGSTANESYDFSTLDGVRAYMGAGDDFIMGTNGVDEIVGGEGNDILNGKSGNDVLEGGQGDDILIGATSQNVYRYAWGDGNDTIIDAGSDDNAPDTLRLTNIDISRVSIELIGDDMIIHIYNEKGELLTPFEDVFGTITIKDGYTTGKMEHFYFGDQRYTFDEALAYFPADTDYYYLQGDGKFIVDDPGGYDTIYFGENIDTSNIIVKIIGNDMMIGLAQNGYSFDSLRDVITINHYTDAIENFYFKNGEILSLNAIVELASVDLGGDEINNAPKAFNATAEAIEDTVLNGVLPIASDVDGNTLTYILKTQPINGTVVVNEDGTYAYIPNENFNGVDSFAYEVSDGELVSEATITLNVQAVNDAPVAADDYIQTNEDEIYTSTISLIANDSDVDGDNLSIVAGIFTTTQGGSIDIKADGSYTYTPGTNFNGVDSFAYEVSDGELVSEATITLNVQAVNDAPVAQNATAALDEDAVLNTMLPTASDVDGDSLTYSLQTNSSHGNVVINPDGSYSYTPNSNYYGADSFVYLVSDGNGGQTTATIDLTINSIIDDMTIYGTNKKDTLRGDQIDVGSNDTIYGLNGNDVIYGLGGNDILDGGNGNDKVYGGDGNDIIYASMGRDYLDGGSGTDTLSYANYNYGVVETLNSNTFLDYILGKPENINFENLEGSKYNDILTGDSQNNTIYGLSGNDTLNGGRGDDTLYGGAGKDILYGGSGNDVFVIDSLNKSDTDSILDFSSKDDTIYLDNSIFTSLINEGTLDSNNFVSNKSGIAIDSDDYIIYETDTGKLFYDADGSGDGAAIQIATLYGLSNQNTLTYSDFMVI